MGNFFTALLREVFWLGIGAVSGGLGGLIGSSLSGSSYGKGIGGLAYSIFAAGLGALIVGSAALFFIKSSAKTRVLSCSAITIAVFTGALLGGTTI